VSNQNNMRPTIQATPITLPPWLREQQNDLVVAADPSIVVEGYEADIDGMAEAILQDIGAVELSMMTRYDSLDGNRMVYSAVSTRSRLPQYSANNLMGQPSSALTANSQDFLNSAHYVQGELNRGYALDGEPTSLDMNIQVATSADIVPFSTSAQVYEVN
jgi:hypothetical protein